MEITVVHEFGSPFETETYTVDLNRRFEGYKLGDLVCTVCPFGYELPLQLELAIRADGSMAFRKWSFVPESIPYLHTAEKPEAECSGNPYLRPFKPTAEQVDTVNGLFSGRIKFEGLKLSVGGSVQHICPINVEQEENMTGKRIFLA